MAEKAQDQRSPDANSAGNDVLSVRIWGARGSIPAPGPATLRYGGETTCLEITAGHRTFVVDCGSGARACGKHLAAQGAKLVDVVFTHTHLDHICGLPFFCCAYDPQVEVNLWGGHITPGETLEEIMQRLMSPPIFPVATSALNNTSFRQFSAGETIVLGNGLSLSTLALNHPGNACGYRIDHAGSAVAVITDHEHGDPRVDEAVARFVSGAHVMIYDAMYLEEEYHRFVGWGHSTPTKGLDLAERAGVPFPVLFHHDPDRTDDALDRIRAAVVARLPTAEMARQGMVITLVNGKRLAEGEADARPAC